MTKPQRDKWKSLKYLKDALHFRTGLFYAVWPIVRGYTKSAANIVQSSKSSSLGSLLTSSKIPISSSFCFTQKRAILNSKNTHQQGLNSVESSHRTLRTTSSHDDGDAPFAVRPKGFTHKNVVEASHFHMSSIMPLISYAEMPRKAISLHAFVSSWCLKNIRPLPSILE